jgi:hypothetical protein
MAKNNSLSLAQEKLSLTILYSVGISKFVEKRPNTFVSLCSLTSERTTCLFPPTHARRLCEQHVSLAVCAAAQQRAVSGRGFRLQQAECPGAFASAASLTRPTPDYELASWMSAPCSFLLQIIVHALTNDANKKFKLFFINDKTKASFPRPCGAELCRARSKCGPSFHF